MVDISPDAVESVQQLADTWRTILIDRGTGEVRDLPGSLARVTACVAEQNANIEQVHHQRAFTSLAVQNAEVDLVLKTRNHEHVVRIVDALKRAGFNARAHPVE